MAKRRVAVLGGGVGAMSAAWALTSQPGARDDYDIHVYQVGWRLGGKGASGRNPLQGQRIEEHGLHIWSGFYDNAFRVMREVFDELRDEPNTYRSVDEAFFKDNNIVLGERTPEGWVRWIVQPAMKDDEPGVGEDDLSPWGYFLKLAALMRDTLDRLDPDHATGTGHASTLALGDLGDDLLRGLAGVGQALGEAPLHLMQALAGLLSGAGRADEGRAGPLARLARGVQEDIRARRARFSDGDGVEDALRRVFQLLDLGGAALRGMVEDRVLWRGFDAIDGEEISHWLEKHGAEPGSVDGALIVAVYDYAFGFRGGMTTEQARAIAAGTFLRGTLRLMLTYKGSIFYKMRGGMGDTIFTPLYKALRKRGVHFHFFHRVRGLHLDPGARAVDSITIERQVTTKGDYRPFVTVKGIDCWPSEPLWDQIEEAGALLGTAAAAGTGDEAGGRLGAADLESSWTAWKGVETRTLRRGEDFDEVILGIPVGALPDIAGDLIGASPAWRRMVSRVQTTATQAMQLWLREPTEGLGWGHGPSILTAYQDALNTWADMSHLVPAEAWPAEDEPRSIAYFCGPLADPPKVPDYSDTGYPGRARDEVKAEAMTWLRENMGFIFPRLLKDDGSFDDGLLVAAGAATPEARWEAQYFRANVEPTERYVLSVPGSTTARLRADRSGFSNLWLAGDWTYTGINAGCVESAVMSGMRAAAGLAGVTPRIVGEEEDPIPGGNGQNEPQSTAPVLKTYRPQNSPWPWSAVYGMAETTGPCVTLSMPRDAVARMLPQGLALAPQMVTGPGGHPVILLFGRQRDVRPNVVPRGWTSYLEFICAVPFVMHTDARLGRMPPMIWPQKLYLDSDPPIALGVYGYGFPKEKARIDCDDSSYVVTDRRTGREIISCAWTSKGDKARAFAFPKFAAVRPAYEMAMVTKRPLTGWQYSVYDFSLDSALLESLAMEVRIGDNGFGLPPGLHRPPSIAEASLGGFFLTADGTINNPFQSRDIRQHLLDMAP
ncbi:hypothetical protein Rumeso_03535 [Rubellimicrobium mesophilum DSM 19309]|uniref:Amine oxidase domain-containing protein n=1 Tax=Rubellimicrobium mesophilum DSM 19309 TaxID=442562 RepID=A0A017HM84_9RHOB|nr:NAD(P)-binding protein [Rubellimicrobium mesophilum]EYD74894.1 hypothetical protein Rumeso_03535 [Rubellimicrobium mesophilum DSM 19309]